MRRRAHGTLTLVTLLILVSGCQSHDDQKPVGATRAPIATKRGPILGGMLQDWRGPLAEGDVLKSSGLRPVLGTINFGDQKGDEYVLEVADKGSGAIVVACAIYKKSPTGLRLLYEAKETIRFSKYIGVTWTEQGDEVTVRGEMGGRPETLVLRLR